MSKTVKDKSPEWSKHGANIVVPVKNNNVEFALRIFKKRVKLAGIMEEHRDRQEYKKPSYKKHKLKQNQRRDKRNAKRNNSQLY